MRCRVPLYGTRGIMMPSLELQQQCASCLPASALGTIWINCKGGKKKKKSLTLQSKQLVLGWADTSWNNTWNDHLYSTDYWHEVTGRYRRNMQIQMLVQGTPKGFWLLYNNPQLWNNSWPISEQAASTVQSWQPTEDAEHILFEEGRSHTEPHPPILARMRPHRATHRWMLQSSPSHTARPVILHICPEVREVSDLRETLGSFLKHYQM